MTKEKYEEFLKNIEIKKYEWITFTEADSILLKNGSKFSVATK